MSVDPIATWVPGSVVLDEYQVQRMLGIGGMGQVFLLRSLVTGTRFAVKKARVQSAAERHRFLLELQTWFGLPEHPHFVKCQFFRTIDDDLAIFAEFVERGSASDALRRRDVWAMSDVLAVAIQIAWALHALHGLNLVHRDVKPANILIDSQNTAKLTDFGLSKARLQIEEMQSRKRLTSSTGTFEYCSPEQFEGEEIGPASDVWSWGLSLIEMFKGGVTWGPGIVAPDVLADHLRTQSQQTLRLVIPPKLAEILRGCFCKQPENRWQNMAGVAVELINIYREEVGHEYPRRPPTPLIPSVQQAPIHDRQSVVGVKWDDPEPWLRFAIQAAGGNPEGAAELLLPRKGTRRIQAVADLATFEEAHRILNQLVADGSQQLRPKLARLSAEKALVHMTVDDAPGALSLLDEAMRECRIEGSELAPDEIRAALNKGLLLERLGKHRDAKELYEQSIPVMEKLVAGNSDADMANDLAKLYHNLSNTLDELHDFNRAKEACDQAIRIRKSLTTENDRDDLARDLAMTYVARAVLWNKIGNQAQALLDYDKAFAGYEALIDRELLSGPIFEMATALINKAAIAEPLEAARLLEDAITLLRRLIEERGAVEAEPHLALAYHNGASVFFNHGELELALASTEESISILRRLVFKEGRHEYDQTLRLVYGTKGTILLHLDRDSSPEIGHDPPDDPASEIKRKALALEKYDDSQGAVALYEVAIEVYRRRTDIENLEGFPGPLAVTLINKAAVLVSLKEDEDAAIDCEEAISILTSLTAKDGLLSVADYLQTALVLKGQIAQRRGDLPGAMRCYEDQASMLSQVVAQNGKWQARYCLAMAYSNVATVAAQMRSRERANKLWNDALSLLGSIDEEEGVRPARDATQNIASLRRQFLGNL